MNLKYDINQSIKDKGLPTTLFHLGAIVLVITVITGIVGATAVKVLPLFPNNNLPDSDNVAATLIPVTPTISEIGVESNNTCVDRKFDENTADWLFTQYKSPDKDGFYCPKSRSKFSSPDMWNREEIPTIFNSLKIKYQLKNKEENNEFPPTFIFSLGDTPRLLRFYVPEKSPQLVGFERIELGTSTELVREDVGTLKDPIKYSTQTELFIRSFVTKGNEATYIFNVNYISDQEGSSLEDTFSYSVKLPDPQPNSNSSKVKFGFGTLEDNCVKPISYEICY